MPNSTFYSIATLATFSQIDSSYLKNALLRKQFLPYVKAEGEELPSIFSSETFTDAAADELSAAIRKPRTATQWVELRTRRFDGLVRRLGIPHPWTYSKLVEHICDNWSDIETLVDNGHSKIKPDRYEDGRIIQMSYEDPEEAIARHTRNAQGKFFLVKADISGCFPSIYSHALDWAARGKQAAKADRKNLTWQARLDTLVRNIHDGETKGLMIGPAVSNLLSEIVLQRVDESLASQGHTFTRYVDDYTAYCVDRSGAERFIVDLHRSLGTFRLDINNRKTQIVDLAHGDHEDWIQEVASSVPRQLTPTSISRYLRRCESLASKNPSTSVLKYSIKLLQAWHQETQTPVNALEIDELIRLCEFHPHLIPFLSNNLESVVDTMNNTEINRASAALIPQMVKASKRDETDVVCWYLQAISETLDYPIDSSVRDTLTEMQDDLVLVALCVYCDEHRDTVADSVRNWTYSCDSDYEQHWLVRYELWRSGLLSSDDLDQAEVPWMDILKKHNVRFSRL